MADLTVPATFPAGEIVALDVSAGEYMEKYAADHFEWVEGAVIKMAPVTLHHYRIVVYLTMLLGAYFERNPIGQALGEPFVMVLENSRREPDLQIVLNENPGELSATGMFGPADICIEVVSDESISRDYGDKLREYRRAGVKEYWIVDPLRSVCDFNRLEGEDRFIRVLEDDEGNYASPLLPKFRLHILTLWQDEMPNISAIVESVKASFTD